MNSAAGEDYAPRRPCAVLQQFRALKFPGAYTYTPPAPRLLPPPPAPRWGCAVSPCRAPPAADLRASPASPAAADLHRSPAPWWAGWLARMAGMVAGLVCQSSVNGQSDRQPARMRFVGGFSPDGQGQGLGAERQPRAKQGAGTGQRGAKAGQINQPYRVRIYKGYIPKGQNGRNPVFMGANGRDKEKARKHWFS